MTAEEVLCYCNPTSEGAREDRPASPLGGFSWAAQSISKQSPDGLFVIAIVIPALCWLTWRRNADDAKDYGHLSFRDWALGEFDTWTGPIKGANATVEVLLPIAAVAIGMTVLGLMYHRKRRRLILRCTGSPLDRARQVSNQLRSNSNRRIAWYCPAFRLVRSPRICVKPPRFCCG
jgi:hypothetical protein